MGSILSKHVTRPVYDEPVERPYRKLQVNQIPIIEVPEKLYYKELLDTYFFEHGKALKPRKPQKNSKAKVPNTLECSRYRASQD